jgi:HAE1 family hydrophobic/amphiphilic exporter-1
MSKFFIGRPIVASVIAILMVIVGVVSVLSLPVAQFPNIVPPEILVSAIYPGVDAETMEQSVATPLEEQISGVDNMNYMYSINTSTGQTSITVDFQVKTDPNIDRVLTQLRTSQAQPQLPAQVNTAGLTVLKSLASPLMLIALNSPRGTYDSVFLANFAYINLVDELVRVPGIAQVRAFGAGQYAMRCWVKPDRLAKLQITVPQIIQALQAQNTVNPAGQIGGEPVPAGQQFTYTVRAQGRLISAEQFGDIILRSNPDGSTLRLKDVARLELGAQTYNLSGRYNGKPSAILACYQLPGSNAVESAKALRARMATLSRRFPQDLTYNVSLDTTASVVSGMREIIYTLFEALGLVVLVVYLFLQGWRASLIPLMAVPVSLVGTFVVFPLLGFTVNTLSLFGLVLAIGLVVDDAIVVVEAVERHIEEGMTPRDAAIRAMEEVSGPVVAIALILSRRLHSYGIHPGYYRQALRAVRGHYRDFGDFLSVQCAFAQSRDGRSAAEAPAGTAGPAGAILCLVQPWFSSRDGRLRKLVGATDSQSRIQPAVPRSDCRHRSSGPWLASALVPPRGRHGVHLREPVIAGCRFFAAHRSRGQAGRKHRFAHSGGSGLHVRYRVQPVDAGAEHV